MQGHFTAYGAIEDLVKVADGRYAVFGSGDELSFSFLIDENAIPTTGKYSYLLEFVGYVKDGDRYTAHPGQVEPMPYLGLNQYPPVEDERLAKAQNFSPFRTRLPLDFTLSVIDPKEDKNP
jgi:hypothetical protein